MGKESNNEKTTDPYRTSRGVKFVEGLNDGKKIVTVTRPASGKLC